MAQRVSNVIGQNLRSRNFGSNKCIGIQPNHLNQPTPIWLKQRYWLIQELISNTNRVEGVRYCNNNSMSQVAPDNGF